MKDRLFFIVNPKAYGGKGIIYWRLIKKILNKKGIRFDYSYTQARDSATKIVEEALNSGYSFIVSVGGDGTINEVVNGFFNERNELINSESLLGVIPIGSGKDFIKTIGIPSNTLLALNIILEGKDKLIDIGVSQFYSHTGKEVKRYFINITSVGVSGETVKRVNEMGKTLGANFTFLYASIVSIIKYKPKNMEIIVDKNKVFKGEIFLTAVANGKYFGSGMKIAPLAEVEDGLFDIILVPYRSKLEILKKLRLVYSGRHINLPDIVFLRGKEVEIKSKDKVLIDMDGEQPGIIPINIKILEKKLRIRVKGK